MDCVLELLLPWLESPLHLGRLFVYEHVLQGAPYTVSPFQDINQGYKAAVFSVLARGGRRYRPGIRLPCTWSLSMYLASFAVPHLAAALQSCICTSSQRLSAAGLRCTYCVEETLRAGRVFMPGTERGTLPSGWALSSE